MKINIRKINPAPSNGVLVPAGRITPQSPHPRGLLRGFRRRGGINASFILVLLIAVTLRVFVTYTKYHCINSDNGILGLMARHILQGELPVFFYGQPYMGSIEAFVIAFFFLLFGISTTTMTLAMSFISTLCVISAYFLGKELKDKTLGLYAMLIAAIPPAYIFWHGLAAFGGYPETILFGNIVLTIALKIVKPENAYKKTKYYLCLGFISGLALWTHLLIVYYLVPIAIFLLINEKKKFLFFKAPLLVIPTFILGSLPLWIHNISHGFGTFKLPMTSNFIEKFIHFFHVSFTLLLGDKFSPLLILTLGIYICSFLFIVLHHEKTHLLINPKFIFFLLFVSIVYFFSKSHMALNAAPRHISPLFTVAFISIAYLSWYLNKRNRYLGLFPVIIVLLFNSSEIYKSYRDDKGGAYTDYRSFTQLINFLEERNLKTNYCTFCISQKLNFLSNEKIINADPDGEKYPPYEKILEASDNIAFVESSTWLEPTLNMLCQSYEMSKMNDFYIYYNCRPKKYNGQAIPADLWKADSNYNNKDTKLAFDRNVDGYWCTIEKKQKGMYFKLDMGKIYKIYRIALLNTNHWRNYPWNIELEVSNDDKQWTKINIPSSPGAIFFSGPRLYCHLLDGRIEVVFDPIECRYIKICQNGEDSLNPWEINELFIWEYLNDKEISASEAEEIYNFASKTNINNIYADFWLSAKLDNLSDGNIKTLKPVNVHYLDRENTSRFLQLGKDSSFIVDNEDVKEFENIVSLHKLSLAKKEFKNYTLFWQTNKTDIDEIFFWTGYGLLKTNRLMPPLKEDLIKNEQEVVFKNGIKLLGYTIQPAEDKLSIDYFWQTKKLPEKIFVFIYFMKNKDIVFQNDHPLLEQFSVAEVSSNNEIFKESYTIGNVPHGTYDIVMGLWIPNTGNKRIEIISPKPKRSKISVGTITL